MDTKQIRTLVKSAGQKDADGNVAVELDANRWVTRVEIRQPGKTLYVDGVQWHDWLEGQDDPEEAFADLLALLRHKICREAK